MVSSVKTISIFSLLFAVYQARVYTINDNKNLEWFCDNYALYYLNAFIITATDHWNIKRSSYIQSMNNFRTELINSSGAYNSIKTNDLTKLEERFTKQTSIQKECLTCKVHNQMNIINKTQYIL